MLQPPEQPAQSRPITFFREITPGLATGADLAPPWRPLASVPLLILVGVTGTGKSTLLDALTQRGLAYSLLPDRRVLTDDLIISTMQLLDGAMPEPVRDRAQRFTYTRRYREQFPGGMAYGLSQLWVDGTQNGSDPANYWLFDGLRGANEVTYAARALPLARFIMLDAPDWIRVQRLLGRADDFDQVAAGTAAGDDLTFDALGLPEAAALFTSEETSHIFSWVADGQVSIEDLQAKLRIVVEERRNYDPAATKQALLNLAPKRMLYIDTTTVSPPDIAAHAMAWLGV